MEILAIIALVDKGLAVISALMAAGQNAQPAIDALKTIFTRDRTKPPTQKELDTVEAVLDSLVDEFNIELPPE